MDDQKTLLMHYMPDVVKSEQQLTSLDDAWEHIKRLAEVTCPAGAETIIHSMEKTQQEFKALQQKLIDNLIAEQLKKSDLEIRSKAQVAVDILIRNLFERSADVGFLATDADIRSFLLSKDQNEDMAGFIQARLNSYASKYTVYEEIIVVDLHGNVRANLDIASPVRGKKIEDSLIGATLDSSAPFCEFYKRSELRPQNEKTLIFSCKITDETKEGSRPIGVLCLCFRFENEMKGIFSRLKKEGDKSVILILDGDGSVIASSDIQHVACGIKFDKHSIQDVSILEYGGREYLSHTATTKGYQGYFGLGWSGHVMVPCDFAFRHSAQSSLKNIAPELLERITHSSDTISPTLTDIVTRASLINLGLRRVVWNGQVMNEDNIEGASKLKAVLSQISKTGGKTSDVFSTSIQNLHETIISSTLDDVKFQASLAIDIMDRNLYERSDDCRWWALTSDFRKIMDKPIPTPDEREMMCSVLEYINSLYTVYTSLFIYNTEGRICAVSRKEERHLIGKKIDEPYVLQTLKLQDPQKYIVSEFKNTDLYSKRPTYIYNAAISSLKNSSKVLGGIGIVFDSEGQFKAMLEDSLPHTKGAFALFCDRHGVVISSTQGGPLIGEKIHLEEQIVALKHGEGLSTILEFNDEFYTVGAVVSSGYREFKNSGDYVNDVIALVFSPIGSLKSAETSVVTKQVIADIPASTKSTSKLVELATFIVDGRRYGLEKEVVVEAVGLEKMTGQVPGASEFFEGALTHNDRMVPVINLRSVFRCKTKEYQDNAPIIVTKIEGGFFIGLLVDDLDSVPEFPVDQVEAIPDFLLGNAGYVKKIVKNRSNEDQSAMIFVIDPALVLAAGKKMSKKDEKISTTVQQKLKKLDDALKSEETELGMDDGFITNKQ